MATTLGKPDFKVGDTVVCVKGHTNLQQGKLYTITNVYFQNENEVDHWFVKVSGKGAKVSGGWAMERFTAYKGCSQWRKL